eukprot:4935840-Amphidinium_carterae.1
MVGTCRTLHTEELKPDPYSPDFGDDEDIDYDRVDTPVPTEAGLHSPNELQPPSPPGTLPGTPKTQSPYPSDTETP